jgi:hypothetical protein
LKVVVLLAIPGVVPVITIGYVPGGTLGVTVRAIVAAHVGLQALGAKDQATPEGIPDGVRVTSCEEPDTSGMEMVVWPVVGTGRRVTTTLPLLLME